jgi:hypothetical protein
LALGLSVLELRMDDRELARLIAPALQQRLREAGFKTGTASNRNAAFYMPINLDLAGHVAVTRYEDGTWIFSQEVNSCLVQRTDDTDAMFEAIRRRAPLPGGGT